MHVLPKGTEITCPTCGRVLARSRKDIKSGEKLVAADFESLEASVEAGRPMKCPYDDTPYWRGNIHTKEGWV